MLVPNTNQMIAYPLSVLGYGKPSRSQTQIEISFCNNRAELKGKHPKSVAATTNSTCISEDISHHPSSGNTSGNFEWG
jgi:hypothetical protein